MESSRVGVAETMKNELLKDMLNAALSAVHPGHAVKRTLRRENNKLLAAGAIYDLDSFDRVVVIGAGKATAHMAAALEEVLGDVIHSGTILVKYGHTTRLRTIEQIESAHPLPDKAGVGGTRKILDMLSEVDAKTLVICLLSGGASALLVDPLPGISLEDKQKSIDLLLRAGASVYELNTVCKHLSGVKGGRLARAAYPASVMTLTLSDVVGDRIDVIASGPTAPGNSTFCEAARIIEKFELRYKLPREVVALIERGTGGEEPETAKSDEACFRRTKHIIVGGIAQALFSAGNKAKTSGYSTELLINETHGTASERARVQAKRALRIRDDLRAGERRCLLFGSERADTTKRNTNAVPSSRELAAAFAQEIAGISGITLLSAGIYETDEHTQAAATMIDGATAHKAHLFENNREAGLENNETSSFNKIDRIASPFVMKCPAGTSTMDIQIILIE